MNKRLLLSALGGLLFLLLIGFILYKMFAVKTVDYPGTDTGNQAGVPQDVIVKGESFDSDTIDFSQRTISGGGSEISGQGSNPGWVISLVETQPNIFTGRVLIDDGVYQFPVTIREEVKNIFVGHFASKDKKDELFSMRKEDTQCTDEEGNVFEYSLTGTYGAKQFGGCGGLIVKEVASN